VLVILDEASAAGKFKQRHAFLNRPTGDAEENLSIWFGESAISFSDVRCDGETGSIELIDEESIAARKRFCCGANGVGEVDSRRRLASSLMHSFIRKTRRVLSDARFGEVPRIRSSPLLMKSMQI
jgi:hypothetical protein